jgi:outer membrane protein, heavy metal efflux system
MCRDPRSQQGVKRNTLARIDVRSDAPESSSARPHASAGLASLRPAWLTGICLSLALGTLTSSPSVMARPLLAEGVAQQAYRLDDLVALARSEGLALRAARLQAQVSRAGISSAQARPNPEIDWATGSLRPVQAANQSGTSNSFTISQRIENASLREARIEGAKIGAQSAQATIEVLDNNIVAAIKTRYFELIKREEELSAAREELLLTEQIRERVAIRFKSGEGARFDLLRAETEVALAEKEIARVSARLEEAKALLRQVVSAQLPQTYTLQKENIPNLNATDLPTLIRKAISLNPEIQRSALEVARADQRVNLEEASIYPGVSLRLAHDREPDYRSTRVGVAISLPLWDRRQGPIAEAKGLAMRSKTDAELIRFDLEQTITAAWQQYQAASNSVQALEGGILERARNVVRIAEAAYRLGERGILEYLDARRQFRAVQADLIVARLDLQLAITELERLVAAPLRISQGNNK